MANDRPSAWALEAAEDVAQSVTDCASLQIQIIETVALALDAAREEGRREALTPGNVGAMARETGRREERAAVVVWLRDAMQGPAALGARHWGRGYAEDIEAGAHLTPHTDTETT